MVMYLYINTTERDSFAIALASNNRIIRKKTVKSERTHSEKLLKSIQQILKSGNASLPDIKGIASVRGPGGSFVSLRIGITTANALAFGLGVPVAGIDKPLTDAMLAISLEKRFLKSRPGSVVLPKYGRPPHITQRKA